MSEPGAGELAGFPALVAEPEGGPSRGPVVFLHGGLDTHESYAGWLQRFAEAGHEGFAASRRGRRGIPPQEALGVTLEDYLDDTMAVLDEVEGKPIVIGHSLGGVLALKLAELDRCAAAVLMAPAGPGPLIPQPRSLPLLLSYLPGIMRGDPFLPDRSDSGRVFMNCMTSGEADAVYGKLVPESGVAFRQLMFGSMRIRPAGVRCPVLCVAGREDRTVAPAQIRSAARRFDGDLREYVGHGHLLIHERGWERIADDVIAWVRTIEAGDSERPVESASAAR